MSTGGSKLSGTGGGTGGTGRSLGDATGAPGPASAGAAITPRQLAGSATIWARLGEAKHSPNARIPAQPIKFFIFPLRLG